MIDRLPPSSMLRAAPKKRFGRSSALRVDAAGEHLAGARYHGVVGAGQAGDGVQEDHHVALVLDQALGLLDHHVRDLHVARRRLVEGRGDDLAAHADGALHFRHFLRPLVDEQHDHVGLGVVLTIAWAMFCIMHGLAGLRRCDEQAALALADRRDRSMMRAGQVLRAAVALSRVRRSSGNSGVRFSNRILLLEFSGFEKLTSPTLSSAK
jgi:hypothetical protein